MPDFSQSKRPEFDEDAADGDAVAAEEFGHRMGDDVGAQLEGAAEIGRGEGIVDHERQAGLVGDLGDGRDVHYLEPGIAERLAVEEARLGPYRRLEGGGVARIDEARDDAEARQGVVEEIVAAAIERGRGDDMPALAHERGDAEMERRLAACRGDGADAAFECRDALLEHGDRRIRDAAVDMAGALEVEERGRLVDILEDEGGGLVDGHGAGARRRIGSLAGMEREGVEFEVLGIDHGRSPSPGNRAFACRKRLDGGC